VVPLRDLKVIADLYAVNIVDMAHKVRNGNIEWEEARKNLKDARLGITKNWTAYKATYLVEQEKKLVASIEPMLAEAENSLNQLQEILEEEDRKAIARYTINTLYPVIDPISTKFSELIEVQLDVAKSEYNESRQQYEHSQLISIVLLCGGTLAGILFAMRIVGSVVKPLRQMQEAAQNVSQNFDYSTRIEVAQNDEVGATARAFNTLLQAQQTAIAQVNKVVQHLADGELNQRIEGELQGDLGQMKRAINNSLDTVQETMGGFNGLSMALLRGQFDHHVDLTKNRGEFLESLTQADTALQSLHRMIGNVDSVMAEEVGKLAASSAESSQEIARLVQQAVAETAQAVQVVQEVSRDMSMIEQGSQETDQMLQRISSALEQQSAAVEEINLNLGSLDRIAISNAAASEEITATVMELSKLAEQTRSDLGRFSV
jgi:hypothetical protein